VTLAGEILFPQNGAGCDEVGSRFHLSVEANPGSVPVISTRNENP
jgi:hypothetical protein